MPTHLENVNIKLKLDFNRIQKNVNDRDMAISVDIEDCPDTTIVTVMLVDPITGRSL